MTVAALPQISEAEAQKLTERIRLSAHNYAEARQKLQQYVAEAKAGNAHLALGYASWTAYLSEVLGDEPMRLARGERQEMVQMLSAEGMSTRAIAPIVGASHMQVGRDLSGVTNVPTEPVQGMDGKTYTRPDPLPAPAPKRRPITDQSSEAGWDLVKAVERIERILSDDRYPSNKALVDGHLKQHLINSAATITSLIHKIKG